MDFSELREIINKFDKMTEEKEIPNTLVGISQSNSSTRSSKKFFDKFFEIADGGNPNWDV